MTTNFFFKYQRWILKRCTSYVYPLKIPNSCKNFPLKNRAIQAAVKRTSNALKDLIKNFKHFYIHING
jgi:hypothetical protein